MERPQAGEPSQAATRSAIATLLDAWLDEPWTPYDVDGWRFELQRRGRPLIPRQGVYDMPGTVQRRLLDAIREHEWSAPEHWSVRLVSLDLVAGVSAEPVVAPKPMWLRSSYQSGMGGVEVARIRAGVAVRDGKNPTGEHFTVPWNEWEAFVEGVKADEFLFTAAA